MSTRIADTPRALRKQPRQARSRATVAAILEAGARILSRHGWAGFTTNAVAEAAGVSIGSLYQYVPDKLALVAAIRDRHIDDSLSAVQGALAAGGELAQFAAHLADALIAAHSRHPGLHRVLLDEAPGVPDYRAVASEVERAYLAGFTAAVIRYRGVPDGAQAERAGMVMSDALDGIVHNAARRGQLQDAAMRDELVRLLRLALAPAAPTPT